MKKITNSFLITKYAFVAFFALIIACSKNENGQINLGRDYMIIEKLENAEKYFDLHPAFEKAFSFLRQENLAELESKRYDLDGDKLFCTISKNAGRKRDEAKLEAHQQYIDIQYVIAGDEEYGWRRTSTCKEVDQPYDAEKDIAFYNDAPTTWKKVPPGYFTIFFPQDAHAPVVGEGEIHKVVFKVAVQ
jgi:YhcH/YjgK/YiaL family protein